MSDSRRHTPKVGNTCTDSEKKDKRLANRAWRRVVKVMIHVGVYYPLPLQKEVRNNWDFGKDGKQWIGSRYPELMRK